MSSKISEIAVQSDLDNSPLGVRSPGNWKLGSRASSWIITGLGAAILVWTVLNTDLRDSEGVVTGRFGLPLAIAIALIVFESFAATKWKSFSGWFGLALVGQAASLQMIDAGRLIHFQHYRSIAELLNGNTVALTLFGLQALCVGIGISSRLPAIKKWLFEKFALWQVILIGLLLVFSSAAVTPDISIYSTSIVIGTLVQLVNIANIILLAGAIPSTSLYRLGEIVNGFLGNGEEPETVGRTLDRFSGVAAIWIVLLTGALNYFVYQSHPHVPDETQYLFQANYMAAGQLSVKAPLVPEAFSMYMVPTQEERWFGIFPPAWPAILAVGTFLGANWLVNPLLAGLCILLTYIFFQQIYSRRFARMGVLLLCCSPWFIFMGMSYMSHVSTLAFVLTGAILVHRGFKTQNALYAVCAGVAVGIAGLIRPLDGAIVGVLLGIWVLMSGLVLRRRILVLIGLVIGTIISTSIVLPYNKFVTGNSGLSPSDAYYAKYLWPNVMALGFGPERGMNWGLDAFPGHSPVEAGVNMALNIFLLNTELFGWGIGSLLLVTLFAVSGAISKKDLGALGVIASIVGAYSLFWYHGGPDFGARYWFLCIVPLIALTVSSVGWISRSIAQNSTNESRYDARVVFVVGLLCIMSLISYLPWRASDKYYHYLGMHPGILQLSKQVDLGESLVLIRGSEHPDYQSAWIYNQLNFEGGGPVYAFDKSPNVRTELLKNYSGRKVWIVNGPTIANGAYRIEQGPLDAQQMLAESSQ